MNFKVSQLKSLGAGEVAVDDLIYVIDSNPTDGSVKSKKVSVGDLIDSRIYGISSSQFVLITGYYADPSWILSLDWSKIINAPSFVTSLSALTDVQLATPISGQALVYNGTKWVNQGIGELDTLNSVTTRGNTTTNAITVGSIDVKSGATYIANTGNHTAQGYTFRIWNTANTFTLDLNGTGSITHQQNLIFGIGNATSYNEAMRIPTTRNVLIGTTTDAGYKLDVNGTARINSSLYFTDPAYTGAGRIYQGANSTFIVTGGPGGGSENITFGPSNRIFINASQARASSLFQIAGGLSVGTWNYPGTYGAQAYISGSTTANGGGGRGLYIDSTIVAAANNDVLVGLDIAPTYTLGAFTGVSNLALRIAYVAGRYISFTQRPGYADYGRIQFTNVTGADIISSGVIGFGPGDGNLTVVLGNGITSKITTPGSTKYDGYASQTPSTLAGSTNKSFLFTSTIPDGNIDCFIFENTSSGSRNLFKIIQNNTTLFIVNPNGNTLIGTTTDNGYKLQVNGNAFIKGSGSTSGTNSLLVQNGLGSNALKITDDAQTFYYGTFNVTQTHHYSHNGGGAYRLSDSYAIVDFIRSYGNSYYLKGGYTNGYIFQVRDGFDSKLRFPLCVSANFNSPNASAILQADSTTQGFLPPRLTTTQKNAITTPVTGLEVYDSTTNTPNYYNGTTWVGVASNQSTGLSPGLFAQTSDSTPVANTTVETTLISTGVGTLSVPANQFQVGASYIAYLSGVISSQNNATMEIHLRSNGFVLADTDLMTLSATTGKFWELHVNFTIRAIGGGGVAAIVTSGRFSYNKDSGNTPESLGFSNINNTTFDTTINNTLVITATWGNASPLNSIYSRIFNLYRVY
jgi:hypothetical protein